jgi:hypothetical protein
VPRIGGDVFKYPLHSPDRDDLGEATYAVRVKPGEEIDLGAGKRFHILYVVPFDEDSPFVAMLKVGGVGVQFGVRSDGCPSGRSGQLPAPG